MYINTLAFISVLDLCDFLKENKVENAEIKVNLLIGDFSESQIYLAVANYKAKIVDKNKIRELLNWASLLTIQKQF